jgi:hypothetical protein
MKEDPSESERREREFDMITFLLAGVLSAIVLGAVGYGIFNSSKGVTTNIPSLTTDVENSQRQSFSNPGAATTGAR